MTPDEPQVNPFKDVAQEYQEWLDELPWIHGGDDPHRAVCEAGQALTHLRAAVRVLAHHLIGQGQAALAERLERAFARVVDVARAIEQFVASPTFDATEWRFGDVEGVAALPPCASADAGRLPGRAHELVSTYMDRGLTLAAAQREAAFWLAWQLYRAGAETREIRSAVWRFAQEVRVAGSAKAEFINSSVVRACGRLALGWGEVERYLPPDIPRTLDEFWEELRLAEEHVWPENMDQAPTQVTPDITDAAVTKARPDGLHVCEDTFTIAVGGRCVKFGVRSAKLFALFVEIARRPGRRVTFDRLREVGNVWGETDVEDTTIKGAVSRLRAKLVRAQMKVLADRLETGTYAGRGYVVLAAAGDEAVD